MPRPGASGLQVLARTAIIAASGIEGFWKGTSAFQEDGMATEQPAADRRGNAILNALPAAERDRLLAEMTLVPLKIKTVLFDAGEVITHVYFPTSGVISLVTPLEEGSIVEVATIGNEGIVGVPIQPHGSLAVRAISQVAGSVLRMDADAFLAETERNGPLRDLVRNYTLALFGQISQ